MMSLFIASLNSGSNGNCYYIGNEQEAVLVDVGISCRETEKRMQRIGLEMQKVKAIFVSHEHTDHIRGIPVLSKKHDIPVYISENTLRYSKMELSNVRSFSTDIVQIGDLTIVPFRKNHDASDPYSFNVIGNGVTIGVFTDIGTVCLNLTHHFQQCHAAFLEANYDDELLENGNYPYHLKRRIKGGRGHLSNKEAFQLFKAYKRADLSLLLLSHLSKNNNSPEIVADLFNKECGQTEIVIASRDGESKVFEVCATLLHDQEEGYQEKIIKRIKEKWVQTSLAF